MIATQRRRSQVFRRRSGSRRRRSVSALRHRIPTTRVPGSTLEQSHSRQYRTDDDTPRTKRVDRVFAARGEESTGRHPGGRHVDAIELDAEDQSPSRRSANRPQRSTPPGRIHCCSSLSRIPSRFNPERTCRSRSRDSAMAAPGSARNTTSVPSGIDSTNSTQI